MSSDRRTARAADRRLPSRLSRRVTAKRHRPARRQAALDTPLDYRRSLPTPAVDAEAFGRVSERFARWMGTAWFIVGMTLFVGLWLAWNTLAPEPLQYDPRALNFTLLTLILSLQASYAAPLILLAQNRQADRDRIALEQDRQRAERGLADTEYLAREVAALRVALRDVATRDYVRSELQDLLSEVLDELRSRPEEPDGPGGADGPAAGGGGEDHAARANGSSDRRSTRTGYLPTQP